MAIVVEGKKLYPEIVSVVSPTPNGVSQKYLMGAHPHLMWGGFAQEGAILADVDGRNHIIYPANQASPALHLMMATRARTAVNIRDLSPNQIQPHVEFGRAVIDLDRQNGVYGMNQNEDRRIPYPDGTEPKDPSQSWGNLHSHGLHARLQFGEQRPLKKDSEGKLHDANGFAPLILYPLMMAHQGLRRYAHLVVPGEQRHNLKYYVPGTLPLLLKARDEKTHELRNMTSFEEASVIKQLERAHREAHRNVFGALAKNYLQVRNSGWEEEFVLREVADAFQKINELPLSDAAKRALMKLYFLFGENQRLLQEQGLGRHPNPKKTLFKGPAFAIAGFADGENNQDNYLTLGIALTKRRGCLETLGIVPRRINSDDPEVIAQAEIKKEQARVHARQIAQRIKSQRGN